MQTRSSQYFDGIFGLGNGPSQQCSLAVARNPALLRSLLHQVEAGANVLEGVDDAQEGSHSFDLGAIEVDTAPSGAHQ